MKFIPSPTRLLRAALVSAALAAAVAAGPAVAQPSLRPLDTLLHDAWGTEDGLPQSAVETLLLAEDGYLWMGSQMGLVRFNGADFHVMDHNSTPALRSSWVNDIVQAPDGTLYVGTKGGGVAALRDASPTQAVELPGLDGKNVVDLAMDPQGSLWIATRDGLFRYDPELQAPPSPVGLEGSGRFLWLGTTPDGTLWTAPRDGGLQPWDAQPGSTAPLLPDRQVSCMLQVSDGTLLVGTDAGLFLSDEDGALRRYGHDLPDELAVTTLLESSDGAIWLGSQSTGLWRLSSWGVERFSSEDGLGVDHVTSMLEDAEGSIWIGTRGGGISRLRSAAIESYPTSQPWTILEDHDGQLWYGSATGLYRLDDRGRRGFPGVQVLPDLVVGSLLQGDDGKLWVGSLGDGVFVLDEGRVLDHWDSDDGLPGDRIYSMAQSPDGTIFLGTDAGVARLADDRVVDLTAGAVLGATVVRALKYTASGELWACTDGAGCHRLGPEGFEPVPGTEALAPPQRLVTAIAPGPEGAVWVTTDGGLLRWHQGRFHAFTEAQGMPVEGLYQVIPDAEGFLWLSGNSGIFRVERSQLEAVAEGQATRAETIHYGHAQGVRWLECNGGSQPAGWRTQDGVMWFPTTGGLVSIDPGRLRLNKRAPPVRLERIRVDGVELSTSSSPTFPPGTWRFEFDYAALTFIGPSQVRYRVMIEGLDEDWIEMGNTRTAYFHSLPPGRHRFRVIAANSDGIWNNQGADFSFEIERALYQRWEVHALATLCLVLLCVFVPLLRIRELKRREAKLEAAVAERTAELRELSLRDPLTGLRNRRFLWEVLTPRTSPPGSSDQERRSTSQPEHTGIIMVDIDHFKQVNDQHGHATGDLVLRAVAATLQGQARAADIVARWGGEEFLLAIRGTTPENLRRFGERLRRAVANVLVLTPSGAPLRRTCSVGICHHPFPGHGGMPLELEQVIALADAALYRAKQRGRNHTVQVLPGPRLASEHAESQRGLDDLDDAQQRGLLRIVEPDNTQDRH